MIIYVPWCSLSLNCTQLLTLQPAMLFLASVSLYILFFSVFHFWMHTNPLRLAQMLCSLWGLLAAQLGPRLPLPLRVPLASFLLGHVVHTTLTVFIVLFSNIPASSTRLRVLKGEKSYLSYFLNLHVMIIYFWLSKGEDGWLPTLSIHICNKCLFSKYLLYTSCSFTYTSNI